MNAFSQQQKTHLCGHGRIPDGAWALAKLGMTGIEKLHAAD